MNKIENRNSIKKNFSIIITRILIGLKEFKEYKSNFWSVFLADIVYIVIVGTFYKILQQATSGILSWNNYDLLVYTLLILAGEKAVWIYSLGFFYNNLKKGDLNQTLTKPVNPMILEQIKIINGATLPTFFILIIGLVLLILNGDYSHLFYSFTLFFFGMYFYTRYFNFFSSFSFFMKESHFMTRISQKIHHVNSRFTPKLFEGLTKSFYYSIPTSIYGFFIIELLNNRFEILLNNLLYIFITLIFFILGTKILWHYGLKKYEAFG